MNISLTLVHNKTDKENEDQILSLIPLLETIETVNDEFDAEGNVVGQFSTFHQQFIGITTPHTVKIYQVVPFGREAPPSIYKINTGGIVYYGKGDEDKVDNHPRFFNWGVKRGMDNGADVCLHVDDVVKIDIKTLETSLAELADKENVKEVEALPVGKAITPKVFLEKGQVDETKEIDLGKYERRTIRG